jgi:hypothetical protein
MSSLRTQLDELVRVDSLRGNSIDSHKDVSRKGPDKALERSAQG